MKPTSKPERTASRKNPSSDGAKPLLQVITTRQFSEIAIKDIEASAYIEEMARELRTIALAANQDLLADLLGAAAQEARIQAGRNS